MCDNYSLPFPSHFIARSPSRGAHIAIRSSKGVICGDMAGLGWVVSKKNGWPPIFTARSEGATGWFYQAECFSTDAE